MSTTFLPNSKLGVPGIGDLSWGSVLNTDAISPLDVIAPLTGLMVTSHEGQVSTSLGVDISAGTFTTQDGVVHTYAGASAYAIGTGLTRVLYLDGTSSWVLTAAASYPSTAHIRLATVVAGATTLTSITDNRQSNTPAGTWYDGLIINVGATTGLQLGSATSQKLGFLGATPATQQAAGTDPLTALATFGFKAAEGTPSIVAGAAAGGSPTVTLVSGSTDRRGIISIVTGGSPTTGILATITFSATLSAAPKAILLTPVNANAAGQIADVFANSANVTTAHFTIDAATALTTATTYLYSYSVQG